MTFVDIWRWVEKYARIGPLNKTDSAHVKITFLPGNGPAKHTDIIGEMKGGTPRPKEKQDCKALQS